jgi:hypothetical protein
MMLWQLANLVGTIAAVYVALLIAYIVTCLAVTRLNRRAWKIQPSRQTPVMQIRRDQKQSVLSLAVIAALLGGGQWSYSTLGWGFRPLPGVGGMVLSFAASLVLFDAWFY